MSFEKKNDKNAEKELMHNLSAIKFFANLKNTVCHKKFMIIVIALLFLILENSAYHGKNTGEVLLYFAESLDFSRMQKEKKLSDYEVKDEGTFRSISNRYKPDSEKKNFQMLAVIAEDVLDKMKSNLADDDASERKPFDYEVERGDTIANIAERYKLKIDTILWANELSEKSVIKPGQKIILLPVDGVLHRIEKGDIVGKIATLHKADVQKIMDYNEISDPADIHPGDMIIVPDGQPIFLRGLK